MNAISLAVVISFILIAVLAVIILPLLIVITLIRNGRKRFKRWDSLRCRIRRRGSS